MALRDCLGSVEVESFFWIDLSAYLRADYYIGAEAPKLITTIDGSHVRLDARSAIKVSYAKTSVTKAH
jgi:ferric-dicitrate binding protein FerR (iron transport regulator)